MQDSSNYRSRPMRLVILALLVMLGRSAFPQENQLLEQVGITKGICVVVGNDAWSIGQRLVDETDLLIYAQISDRHAFEAARTKALTAGVLGTRIFIEFGPAERLYLADNVANVLITHGDAAEMPVAEALRVIQPGGRVWLGGTEHMKAIPTGIDEWSHAYHGPDNNPQSKDAVAKAPYLTQFLADPRYAPLPQVAVAAGGRVFKAFGHIAFKPREEPWLNTLAAFDGYNGTLLWKRETAPALMVHRSTLIATTTKVYFGDDQSCKIFDATTGELLDEIVPPEDLTGGTFWKWMALQDGVLYAMVGEGEHRDPTIRLKRLKHGWPWNPLSPGYNQAQHPWGFGRTLLAIDPDSHKVLWHHKEEEPIDSRAVCLNEEQIFVFRFDAYLTCLDAKTGEVVWRKTPQDDPAFFKSLGSDQNRQDWRTNWRTTAYLKCSERALYFAGPQVQKLVAVSAYDGKVLWEHPYSNYQLVVRPDGVFALSGQMGKEVGAKGGSDPELAKQAEASRVFDPLTGEILAEINVGRRACTRPTGSLDSVFCRASGGSTRLDVVTNQFGLVSPMRAQCHDGVTIANGLLYWWPSTCDCNLTLYGITCLGPAGDFNFAQTAVNEERLETFSTIDKGVAAQTPADWPTFRANNTGTVTTAATVPDSVNQIWSRELADGVMPTAPTAVGDLFFVAGSNGAVLAMAAKSGKDRWTVTTGGAVRLPPTIAAGRALVGSGDGWVYAWEAASGRNLWRFRAAPAERRIPVYGQLQSTWPAASGVVVDGDTAYVAAGIVNYDGTHVYALDTATGKLRWQNNTSGHLQVEARTGVSVQGQLLLHDNKLFLAGGNVVSPGIYDTADGRLLNDPANHVNKVQQNNVPSSQGPRGSELYVIGNQVLVSGKPFYAHPKYRVYDASVDHKVLVTNSSSTQLAWIHDSVLLGFAKDGKDRNGQFLRLWNQPKTDGLEPVWGQNCPESLALAVGANAVVVATPDRLTALSLADGKPLWSQPLPAPPVRYGLAINRYGHILVTLQSGEILCFGASEITAVP